MKKNVQTQCVRISYIHNINLCIACVVKSPLQHAVSKALTNFLHFCENKKTYDLNRKTCQNTAQHNPNTAALTPTQTQSHCNHKHTHTPLVRKHPSEFYGKYVAFSDMFYQFKKVSD